jgi:hypothetical protein
MSIEKMLSNSDATVNASLQQIAKILTATEGKDTTDKRDEIFSILMEIGTLNSELQSFCKRKEDKVVNILQKWIVAESVIDVIELKHGKAEWYFVFQAARIPTAVYNQGKPKDILHTVANTVLQTISKKAFYVYGDSRINGAPGASNDTSQLVCFFMAFKAGVVPQGI